MKEKVRAEEWADFICCHHYWQHRPVALSYTLAGIEDFQ
jgi:hypothetical protein